MPEFIPAFSLQRQTQQLRPVIAPAVERVLASGRFIQGPECAGLEQEVAGWLGQRGAAPGLAAVTCASGTDALHLALRAVGIQAGDVVLTTAFSFFATAGAVLLAGARPEFVDVEPGTLNLAPAALEQALLRPRTARIGAIVPVHLYGRMADMAAISALAAGRRIPVVEDAAQAIGAAVGGRPAGAWGAAGCFSFYPTKNLGAMGEGGLVTTADAEVLEQLRLLRVHGSRRRYEHEILGWNARMDELQAAILRAKLPYLEGWNRRRVELAGLYDELLGPVKWVRRLAPATAGAHVYHQFVIRAPRREELRQYLTERQIGTEVYYPIPLHQQSALAQYATGACPEAERAAAEVLALPMFPELTEDEVVRMAAAVAAFYA
ncbi:MAG: DegT/DnrJ/EryC1/StrS family aminotransferase [Terriglobales bacterium]